MGAEPRAIQLTSAPFPCNSCWEFITLIRLVIYEAKEAPFVGGHVGKEIPDEFTWKEEELVKSKESWKPLQIQPDPPK